ncbi:LRR receptor-like serine/threonine-protein kinase FLS2 [Glycine max]|nr:LRR receptor-like serine/threonine-protein kinase FLS2 [Glycine max]
MIGGLVGLTRTIPQIIVPKSLCDLPNHQELPLHENRIFGSILSSIRSLKKLKRYKTLLIWEFHQFGRIDVDDDALMGHIPNNIGQMQALEKLDLSSNMLCGSIPSYVTNLTGILVLFMDTNYLQGTIPFPSRSGGMPYLSFIRLHNNHLICLQRVSLSNNKLEGALASSLGNLHSLTQLYLSDNSFSSQIPESIGQLSQLIMLNISNNLIEWSLPQEMSTLQNLQTLHLSFNYLNLSSIPPWLTSLSSLSHVYLAGSGIKDQIADFLQTTQSSIQELDLSENLLSGLIPSWIGSLSQLYLLKLSRNSLDSNIPKSLINLAILGVLDLHSNKITGSITGVFDIDQQVEAFGVGEQLNIQYLNLSHNFLNATLPSSLGKLKSNHNLDLIFNELPSMSMQLILL